MTLGFAESMPESDNVVYHVEWLENQQAFPPLSSTTGGGGDPITEPDSTQDEWQFLHRHEILQAQDDFPSDDGHHQLKTCEMEDTWQQVDVLREKQFVDIAAQATHLPEPRKKKAPVKPQRQHQATDLTEEQKRHFYWEMIDRLDEQQAMMATGGGGGGDFYDLYYDRKTHSNHKNNGKYGRRYHMELLQRWHHQLENGDLWTNGKKLQRWIAQVQSTSDDCLTNGWGRPPALNPRLIQSLVMPRHHHRHVDRSSSGSGSKVFKSFMEPDFCLQVKNG